MKQRLDITTARAVRLLGAAACALGALAPPGHAFAQERFAFRPLESTSGAQTVAIPGSVAIAIEDKEKWGAYDRGAPEYRHGCPVPFESSCQSLTYLQTSCGQVQLDNEYTCHDVLGAGFEASAAPKKVGVIDPTITAVGIDVLVQEDASKDQAFYVADLASYASKQADWSAADDIAIDLYEAYRQSGTKVYSCNEYVAKKTWSVSALELEVGKQRQNLRFVVDKAFSDADEDWAMAETHGALKGLYDMEGKKFADMFGALPVYKNLFVAGVPDQPKNKVGQSAPGPSLKQSFVSKFGLWGLFTLAAIENVPDRMVVDTWQRQTKLAKSLSYDGGSAGGAWLMAPVAEPTSEAFGALSAGDDEGLSDLLGSTQGAPRRYLDEELNELYELQQRLRRVYYAWADLNLKYAGSGWTVAKLHPAQQDDGDDDGGGFVAAGNLTIGGGGGGGGQALDLDVVIIDWETEARKAVLDELGEILTAAYEAGAIAAGITPADWSPRQFTERVFHAFTPIKDDFMQSCRAFAGSGTFDHLTNLHIEAVKVTPAWIAKGVNAAEFNCTIDTGSTLTISQFEALKAKNAECKEKAKLYAAKKKEIEEAELKLKQAQEVVHANPDLVGEDGELKAPGQSFHWNEDKGNKYFGLGLTLDAAYEAPIPGPSFSICRTQLEAHGEIDAYIRAMSFEKSLFNARAELSTKDRHVGIDVQLFGKSIYVKEKSWNQGQALVNWSPPNMPSLKKGDSIEAGATIVIVVVPVSFKAGIAGEVGVKLNASASASANLGTDQCPTASLTLGVEPYAKVEGFMSVSIDAKIVEVGLRGYLTILDIGFPLDFTGALKLTNAGAVLDLNTSLRSRMTTLSGRLELYGKVGFCPVCWKGAKTLVSWDGLSWNRTLFAHDYEVRLADLGLAFGRDLGDSEGN
jgi:hypothetical protein